MSGAVVQLVATGAQDEWLTGKPEISFYRSNYKRHTHYSASAERQIIQGTPLPGGISTIRFEKKGDLLNYVYFVGKDTTGAVVPGVDWSKVIDKLELLIGGQVIDTQDMVWTTQVEPVPGAQTYSTRYLNTNTTGLTNVINGFLPLKFFFCKDWSASLPLNALQFHDVEIRITWNNNLGYRVNYEIYSVAANSTATVPSTTPPGIVTTVAATAAPFTSTAAAAQTATISATLGGGIASVTVVNGGTTNTITPTTVAITGLGGFNGVLGTVSMGLASTTTATGSGLTASQTDVTVTFSGGTAGTQATAKVSTSGAGAITSFTMLTTGSGYTVAPTGFSTLGGTVTLTLVYTIASIAVTTAGTAYFNGGAVTLSGNVPTGASATIVVNTASKSQQASTFTYSGANFQMVPGAYFTPAGLGGASIKVVSVTAAGPSSGTFTGYLSAAGPVNILTVTGSQALAGYDTVEPALTFTGATPIAFGGAPTTYTGVAVSFTPNAPSTSVVPTVNALFGTFSGGGSPGTNAIAYISAVSMTSDTAATISVTVIGPATITGSSSVTTSATCAINARYPLMNMSITPPTSGTIVPGMSMLGFVTASNQNQYIPTVANVYSTGIISIATNQFQLLAGPAAAAPVAIGSMDTQYASTSLVFVPTSYYAGSVGSAYSLVTSGATNAALALQYTTLNGAAAASYPTLGATVFFVNPGQAVNNCYVQTGSSATSFGISYTSATAGSVAQNAQFFVYPQVASRAQISIAQPIVDNVGVAVITLAALTGTTPIAIGQQVVGTGYTGPVSVSRIISQGAFSASSATVAAVVEVSFPVQAISPSSATGTGTLVQFIDPTAPLSAGVTVSTTGFNGTYQQLQYEAWCNYVYLDQTERDYFAKTKHDILITQVQRILIQGATYQEISIAQPVKYIAFLSNNYSTAYQQSQTAGYPTATSYYLKTQINGVDVGDSRSMLQWQDVTQYYHTPFGYNNMGYAAPVALIPYCLDTSKLQPTGTLNFSRLDNYRVVAPVGSSLLQLSGGASYFYAVNYNILRIQNGLGGLLYAN